MPITYAFDRTQDLIRTTVSGDNDLAAIKAHISQVAAEPWFPAPAIVDTRAASANLPSAEIRSLVETFRRLGASLRGQPIAVLVPSDLAFGLVRMMELMLDDAITIRPFRQEREAMEWLSVTRPHVLQWRG